MYKFRQKNVRFFFSQTKNMRFYAQIRKNMQIMHKRLNALFDVFQAHSKCVTFILDNKKDVF